MKRRLLVLPLLLLPSVTLADTPPRPYAPEARATYIERALAALHEIPAEVLRKDGDYARSLARGACAAGSQRLRAECLTIAADRYCSDRAEPEAARCRLGMDVVTANVLAEERLLPIERRYAILRDNPDPRRALATELRRIQGNLAADFRLATGGARSPRELAASIDRYCLSNADASNLPYQTCVASLVWFIEGPR